MLGHIEGVVAEKISAMYGDKRLHNTDRILTSGSLQTGASTPPRKSQRGSCFSEIVLYLLKRLSIYGRKNRKHSKISNLFEPCLLLECGVFPYSEF